MKKVKIFLASSAELDIDKEKFELFISKKNKDLYKKRIYLELNTWKDFISSIQKGRTQDEYNLYISQCDISVFLFHTKIGRFTREEFDNAHEAFLTCKHKNMTPRIYTYFKNENEETVEINNFKEYIDSLNHFYDTYDDLNELFVKFGHQLDKLENEDVIIKPDPIDVGKIIKYTFNYLLIPFLVLSGAFFSYYYFQPTNLSIKISEPNPISNLPYIGGKLILTYGDKTDTLLVQNEAIFKQIPSKYKHKEVRLNFVASGYEPIDTMIKINDLVELKVRRDNSLGMVFGCVRDEAGIPLKDVVVSTKGLKTNTDINGLFKIEIPHSLQSESIRLTAFKKGYNLWDFENVPSQNVEWKIILQK